MDKMESENVEAVVETTTEASPAATDAPSPTEQNFRNLIAQVRAVTMAMHSQSLYSKGPLHSSTCVEWNVLPDKQR